MHLSRRSRLTTVAAITIGAATLGAAPAQAAAGAADHRDAAVPAVVSTNWLVGDEVVAKPLVSQIDGEYADESSDTNGDPEDIWTPHHHGPHSVQFVARSAGTLHITAWNGEETRVLPSHEVVEAGRGTLELALPEGWSFAEYTFVVEADGHQSDPYHFLLWEIL